MIPQITMGEWEDWALVNNVQWCAGNKYFFDQEGVKCYFITSGDLHFFFRKEMEDKDRTLFRVLTDEAFNRQIQEDTKCS